MTQPSCVVVIGAGVAGVSTADSLRRLGFTGRVVVVGAEPELPYRRPPLSKDLLRGERTADAVRLKPAAWYAQSDVELLTATTATALDLARREVALDDGRVLAWDRLVLATGGRARPLPGTGWTALRGLADLPALTAALGPGRRLVVVGAGLVGAEVAASAVALGTEVTLLEAAPAPLSRVLPPPVADAYAGLHRRHGVDLRLGTSVAEVVPTTAGAAVRTADGDVVGGDAVVAAVGMAPDTALARAAGLAVGTAPADGVLVDADGATSAPGVYGVGDVACPPDGRTGRPGRQEHWHAAQTGGTRVAHGLLGLPVPPAEVPWAWSDQHGVNLQICGWPAPDDDLDVRGDLQALDATVLLSRDGRLTGAVVLGRPREARALRELLARGASLSDVRAAAAV